MQSASRRVSDYTLPIWHHVAFGGVMGGLLAMRGLPSPWSFLLGGAVLVAIAMLVRFTRKTTGRFVNGFRSGITRWVSVTVVVIFMMLTLSSGALVTSTSIRSGPILAGLVMFFVAAAADWLWVQAYRAELQR